jgi:hypothetical protein
MAILLNIIMLQIRNIESGCCIRVVKNELYKLGLNYKTVKLGKVELKETISVEKLQLVDAALRNARLEIINDTKNLLSMTCTIINIMTGTLAGDR